MVSRGQANKCFSSLSGSTTARRAHIPQNKHQRSSSLQPLFRLNPSPPFFDFGLKRQSRRDERGPDSRFRDEKAGRFAHRSAPTRLIGLLTFQKIEHLEPISNGVPNRFIQRNLGRAVHRVGWIESAEEIAKLLA